MEVTLGDVCEKGTSNLKQSDVANMTGEYPIYGATGYIGNVDFYHQEKPYVAIVKDGAGIGRTTLHPAKSSVIGTMQYLLPKDNVLPEYLCYVVRHMHLEKYFTGATIPHIYFRDYKNEKFNLDSLDKQEKIIEILGKAESIVLKRRKELAELDNLIKARFVEMFGNEREFEKWDCCTVGDVAEVCVGVVIKPTQYYASNGIPAFRSLNIGEMYVKDNDWVYFTEEGHKANQKSVVKENDVLIVRSGAPGTACVVSKKYAGFNAVDIIIAHPNKEIINSIFLAMFTNLPHGMNQIRGGTGGAAQQHFNVSRYKALKLILPPFNLQQQFADFVKQVDKSKFAVQKALDKAQLLFDSLMQQYFG